MRGFNRERRSIVGLLWILLLTVGWLPGICPAAGEEGLVDVVLAIDNSGSMRKNDPRFLTPKTVRTFLGRLVQKGALSVERRDRVYHYSPAVDEGTCVREETRSFMDRVYGGALTPMLAHFLEHQDLTAEDVAELRRMLDEKGGD